MVWSQNRQIWWGLMTLGTHPQAWISEQEKVLHYILSHMLDPWWLTFCSVTQQWPATTIRPCRNSAGNLLWLSRNSNHKLIVTAKQHCSLQSKGYNSLFWRRKIKDLPHPPYTATALTKTYWHMTLIVGWFLLWKLALLERLKSFCEFQVQDLVFVRAVKSKPDAIPSLEYHNALQNG